MGYRHLMSAVLVALTVGVAATAAAAPRAKGGDGSGAFTSEELQAAMRSFADSWASQIVEATARLARQMGPNIEKLPYGATCIAGSSRQAFLAFVEANFTEKGAWYCLSTLVATPRAIESSITTCPKRALYGKVLLTRTS